MSSPLEARETASATAGPNLGGESDVKMDDASSTDSGFVSGSNSTAHIPHVSLTHAHLKHLNKTLEAMQPAEILRFAKILFPNLYQTTAFGLTGLVTLDMLSKLQEDDQQPVDIIFLDTLYHFKETYDLVERCKKRYPNVRMHLFKPDGVTTVDEFEATYGEKLYETSGELYDWIAKVEPQQRSYQELGVAAVLTGRRRSQGAARASIPVIEVDDERGVIKINPLVNWSFHQVQKYIRDNDVPYNELLDRGYKSIGDWHSTVPVGEGEDERAGRWKGQSKTECGIHNKKSRYAQFVGGQADAASAPIIAN